MRPLLIVKTGNKLAEAASRPGDFEDWIAAGTGMPRERVRVARVHEAEPLPEPQELAGVVVTGAAAMVTDRAPWSERTAVWLRGAVEAELPTLGICFGHQLLGYGCGGEVGPNPRGREIGTVEVVLDAAAASDPLFRGLEPTLRVHATHVESLLRLPPGARRLASNAHDPNQAFAIGRRAWGVQFHPEFDAATMRGYLAGRRAIVAGEGLDPDALSLAVSETPHGSALLRRFAELLLD
ncbi:MAG: glutamine amidotransferase [Deltaproteobacteria bacterium]|nr:MAG: glutamine amidotransferase [Deltaproteobacteria bacterium]